MKLLDDNDCKITSIIILIQFDDTIDYLQFSLNKHKDLNWNGNKSDPMLQYRVLHFILNTMYPRSLFNKWHPTFSTSMECFDFSYWLFLSLWWFVLFYCFMRIYIPSKTVSVFVNSNGNTKAWNQLHITFLIR